MSVLQALDLLENDFVICFVVGKGHADLWSDSVNNNFVPLHSLWTQTMEIGCFHLKDGLGLFIGRLVELAEFVFTVVIYTD